MTVCGDTATGKIFVGAGTAQKQGGGGRIALWLTGTGEDFSGFSGTVHAWGGLNNVLFYRLISWL